MPFNKEIKQNLNDVFKLTVICYTINKYIEIDKSLILIVNFSIKLWKHSLKNINFPIGCGFRIHRLHLCRVVPHLNKCPGYDTKQSDGEVPVMLELWEMQSTPSLQIAPRSTQAQRSSTW